MLRFYKSGNLRELTYQDHEATECTGEESNPVLSIPQACVYTATKTRCLSVPYELKEDASLGDSLESQVLDNAIMDA